MRRCLTFDHQVPDVLHVLECLWKSLQDAMLRSSWKGAKGAEALTHIFLRHRTRIDGRLVREISNRVRGHRARYGEEEQNLSSSVF